MTPLERRTGAGLETTMLDYDAFGRPARLGDQTMAYGALGERVRLTSGGEPLLFPERGFEYLVDASRVNELVFVREIRVASSAITWVAPSAASARGSRRGGPAQARPHSGQRGTRGSPVYITVSDPAVNVDQRFPLIAVVPVTGTPGRGALYPELAAGNSGLAKTSFALVDRLRSIDKRRIRRLYGGGTRDELAAIDLALALFLGLAAEP